MWRTVFGARAGLGPALPLLSAAVLAGCATQQPERSSPMAAVAPQLSVERFLQATNARDYDAMARLFGTADGSVAETGYGDCGGLGVFGGRCASPEEVEQHMALLAEILRHDDYRIVSERAQPGRKEPAQRIGVTLTKGEQVIPDVEFILVRSGDGTWLVESVDTEKVAGV